MEESAFPATAGPRDGNDFAGENFQGDATQGIHTGFASFIRFMEVTGFEHVRDKSYMWISCKKTNYPSNLMNIIYLTNRDFDTSM
jgi:hypothetical protein